MNPNSEREGVAVPFARNGYGFANERDRLFPNMVHVDLINICNLGCIHCPQANIRQVVPGYKPNQLDFDIFRRIVDEVAEHKANLRITCDGEPFLYKHIVEAIRYIKQAGVEFATLTTNGTLLNQEFRQVILEPADTKFVVDFSLDALYRSTYDKIRQKGNFLAAYSAVFALLRERKKYPNLRTIVNIIEQDSVAPDEVDSFKSFWAPLVDEVVVRTYVDVKGSNSASQMKMATGQERWPCSLLWNRMAISSYGRPRFCVDDWRERSAFAQFDLRKHSLAEIWQSSAYESLREQHLAGRFDEIEICSTCRDWFGLQWGYDYKTVIDRLYPEPASKQSQESVSA